MLRRIVPMGVATGGVWSFNLRALRHVFTMRCSPAAEEEILLVASMMFDKMVETEPLFFKDFYKEEGFWVAHCLEFDVLGHGKTKKEAVQLLGDAIRVQVEASVKHKNFRNLFSPADAKYQAMFAAGKDIAIGGLEFEPIDHVTIENVVTREYPQTEGDLISI